ncbi:hypothetical protein RB195_022786 [Necator americanus]|uniref:Isopropylmalate dehydrogenase-like domain-containing protein n=1 Tax=Necator americanus TaxID=51031 RepID=A0ABR1EGL6_NECAM
MAFSRVLVPMTKVVDRVLLRRCAAVSTLKTTSEPAHKLKVTIIPGDGVGPELIYSVQDIVKNTGIPLDFEEIFLSEVHYTRSASIENAVKSIARNNNVALKGAIQESAVLHTEGELSGLNMRLRRALDLFANVVHIKSLEGIKTRHGRKLDFVIVREQTEGEYSSLEHELVPGSDEGDNAETLAVV